MREYAWRQLSARLDKTILELHHAAGTRDEEAIHQLRVSIRRLLQALKTFAQYLPKETRTQIRHELRGVIKAAGAVRNHDVLLEMLAGSSVDLNQSRHQRSGLKQELLAKIQPLLQPDLAKRWRESLGIPAP